MRIAGFALVAVACTSSDSTSPYHWVPGKGDGVFDLVEAGPAPVGGSVDIALDHRVPAYRVESFGGTRFAIDLAGKNGTNAYVVVEGPLDGAGDAVAVGAGTVVAETSGAHLDLIFDQPGVYRILAGTVESLGQGQAATGALALAVACEAQCTRGFVDNKTFVHAVAAQPGFVDYATGEIGKLVPDQTLAQQLAMQLQTILADPNLAGLERFPDIAMAQVATVRPALGAIPTSTPMPDAVVTGDLMQLLGACTPDRSLPAELDPQNLPGVRYGQFPSTTLSPCQFAHASKLAAILTSLAANNGSSITYGGQTIATPHDLIAALVASGHTIEIRNERMYANFLSLIVGDKDLAWPVWTDTGLALSTGDSFTIPVGHSQHAWWISGPDVNTRVTFFLGISGAGFFGQTDTRPAWSGTIASTDVVVASATSADYAYLLATIDTATAYLQRNRVERTTVAAGMPADGYGYVGVCNDSTATIEYVARGTITTFPLLRAKALDAQPDLGDGLDAPMRALPKDGDGIVDPHDALARAVAMQPFADGSPLVLDATLAAQIATARSDLGK